MSRDWHCLLISDAMLDPEWAGFHSHAYHLILERPLPLKASCSHVCILSRFSLVWLFATLWTLACQAPLSTGFSRKNYWSGLPCPPPGDLHDPGIHPTSPALSGGFFITSTTWEVLMSSHQHSKQGRQTSAKTSLFFNLSKQPQQNFPVSHWIDCILD